MLSRVLVADDDPALRKMLETVTEKWGYEVVAAANGEEAWSILQGPEPPELALVDWMMPGVDGVELCRRVREMGSGTYVVLLTARDGKEDLVAGFEAGADDFMTKPVHLGELKMRLRAGQRRVETGGGVERAPARTPEPLDSFKGRTFGGKYRIERQIGSGGMGTVWEGVHVALGSKVAVKLMKQEATSSTMALARFEIEARAAARLRSKYAVRVYDYGLTDDGIPYLVMERLEGLSLAKTVAARGPLPVDEVVAIVSQCAQALAQAHSAGIVHRDLKPENIILAVDPDGAREVFPATAKLIDFGVAKFLSEADGGGSAMTRDGLLVGTPSYMSPEQITASRAMGAHVDLWALAACAFYAMTGTSPFGGDTLGEIAWRICVGPLPVPSRRRPDGPLAFDRWFAKACSRDPGDRPQSALDLARSLEIACSLHQRRTTAPPTV